jgi:hypothetical protein
VYHFGLLVLFRGYKGNGMTFCTVEPHGFHMGIVTESDLPHPLNRILDVSSPDSRQGEAGDDQDSD